jgi:hypothetical protein
MNLTWALIFSFRTTLRVLGSVLDRVRLNMRHFLAPPPVLKLMLITFLKIKIGWWKPCNFFSKQYPSHPCSRQGATATDTGSRKMDNPIEAPHGSHPVPIAAVPGDRGYFCPYAAIPTTDGGRLSTCTSLVGCPVACGETTTCERATS